MRPDTTPSPVGNFAWQNQAACVDSDVSIFFPQDIRLAEHERSGVEERDIETLEEKANAAQQAALDTCSGCPVRQECFDSALANGDIDGIWGGTTEDERRLRRKRAEVPEQRIPHGSVTGATNHRCTCSACSQALRVYRQDQKRPIDTSKAVQNLPADPYQLVRPRNRRALSVVIVA